MRMKVRLYTFTVVNIGKMTVCWDYREKTEYGMMELRHVKQEIIAQKKDSLIAFHGTECERQKVITTSELYGNQPRFNF